MRTTMLDSRTVRGGTRQNRARVLAHVAVGAGVLWALVDGGVAAVAAVVFLCAVMLLFVVLAAPRSRLEGSSGERPRDELSEFERAQRSHDPGGGDPGVHWSDSGADFSACGGGGDGGGGE